MMFIPPEVTKLLWHERLREAEEHRQAVHVRARSRGSVRRSELHRLLRLLWNERPGPDEQEAAVSKVARYPDHPPRRLRLVIGFTLVKAGIRVLTGPELLGSSDTGSRFSGR